MKIKNLFVAMLAGAAMVSCSNEDFESGVNNGAIQAGDQAFVSVNIFAPGVTRATGGFEDGLAAESAVSQAVFLFLDGNYNGCANPFTVSGKDLAWETSTTNGETKKATTLVIDGIKDEVPAYIVAILNPTKEIKKKFTASTSLDELKDIVAHFSTFSTNFVMSNAVYAAGNNKEVVATPITLDNIAKTKEDLASTTPVTIQVERVVGKVAVASLDGAISGLNSTGLKETIDDKEDLKLEFVLTGWEVLQNKEARLIKNIDATDWSIDDVWAGWNDFTLKRSYWANDYTTENGRTSYLVGSLTGKDGEYKYVEETVNQKATSKDALNSASPYLLVSGKFVDASTKQAVDLVEWKGQKYTKEGYLNLIAGMAKVSQYYTATTVVTSEGAVTKYTSFTADLLELVDNADNDWGATAMLKKKDENGNDIEYAFYTVDFLPDGVTVDVNKVQKVETPVVEAAIAEFGEVQYWNGGNTYYFAPIKHQAATAATETEPATNFYGVVRNHVYKMNISSITGYGTPVANPNQAIDEPEDPTEGDTYMNAEVVILDWRIVENNVDL